jgi:membrane protease YdiL (CAAX protease family)
MVALVALLFILGYARDRSNPVRHESSAELAIENLLVARQTYMALHLKTTTGQIESLKTRLIAGHWEAAIIDPTPPSIRRLAICLFMIGDERWKSALQRLSIAPSNRSSAAVERELALWQSALNGNASSDQVREFERAVHRMELGWYAHIALEALYRGAGLETEAVNEARLANRSSARVFLLGMLGAIAGVLGLGLCALLGLRLLSTARRYRPPLTPLDRLLTPRAPWPYTPRQRSILYYLFISYLASVAILRIATGWLGVSPLLGASTDRPVQSLALAIRLSLLPLVLPTLLLLRVARREFIKPAALGFCTANWKVDVLCGVAGYMSSIPLLYVARTLSERLFRGVETPVNPAISSFAGTESTLFQALIFLQAAMLAPLIEETLFRGVFFQSLEDRTGRWLAAVIASGVFAVLHPQLPLGFLGIFVLGMVFNALFVLRRSLLPGIVAHALNNGLILLFLLTLIRE